MNSITPYQAVKRMRELTNVGLSFSFEFLSYSKNTGISKGLKRVEKAMLRSSLTSKQSALSGQLVAYKDVLLDKNRQFHLPLLTKFNNYQVKA